DLRAPRRWLCSRRCGRRSAATAGMVFTAYLNAANPKDGTNFELDAIAACFIGGAAVTGGVGTVIGAMTGGLVMGVLNLGLANMSVDQNRILLIKGLVLLAAVAFDVVSKKRGKPSFIGLIMRGFSGKSSDGAKALAASDLETAQPKVNAVAEAAKIDIAKEPGV
ncbi:MAG TPA: hypothetical protein PKX10_00845, partial [Propioniciclava tarda]|nr:hypothetical protein [Propioniciclava tarda]